MNTTIRSIIMAVIIVFALAAPAVADPSTPVAMDELDVPTHVEITQKDDLSSQLFRRMLGSVWTAVAGETTVPDRYGDATSGPAATFGKFSELFPTILGVTGVVAATFAAGFCIYLAGIFALTTAHEGKKLGGSKLNSLWVPVRMGTGLTLSVPAFWGISLLQWAVIAAVALGINWANLVWNAASTYIVSATSTDVQSVPPAVEQEARDLIQPTFQAVLVQEILKRREGAYPNEKIKSGAMDQLGGTNIQGDYVIEHRAREGRMIIWFMPGRTMSLGSLGGVSIPAPVWTADLSKNPKKKAEYDAMLAITHVRLQAFFQAAESLRMHARYYGTGAYLGWNTEEANRAAKPTLSGADIVEEYKRAVADGSAASIEFLAQSAGSKAKLSAALGLKSDGVQGGWMTAGVMPFLLATAQSQFDLFSYGGGMQFLLIQDVMPDGTTDTRSSWRNFVEYIGFQAPIYWTSTDMSLLTVSTRYCNQEIMGGRVYTGHDQQGDSQGLISRAVTKIFFGGQLNNSGILSTTMSAFASQNPISATVWFGDRLMTLGLRLTGISVGAGAVGMMPGLGFVNEIVNNPITLFLMGCLIVAGGVFCYIVPVYFLIVWFQALWPWVVSVVQTLIAAPIWAVMHILPEGEGFAGQHARKGYVQLLDVALRPVLLVAAVCLSYITIEGAAYVVHELFSVWVSGTATYNEISTMSQVTWSILYVSIVFLAYKTLAVDYLIKMPGQIITWAGGIGMSMGSAEGAAKESTTIVGGALGSGSRTISGAGAHIGGHKSSGGGKDKDKDKDKDKGGNSPKADLPAAIAPKKD